MEIPCSAQGLGPFVLKHRAMETLSMALTLSIAFLKTFAFAEPNTAKAFADSKQVDLHKIKQDSIPTITERNRSLVLLQI